MSLNGRLNETDLVTVDGWALLQPVVAYCYNMACAEMVALGFTKPSITAPDGAYRTLAGQVYWKSYWTARGKPGNAATPGFSNHGWAMAVDLWNVYRYPQDILRAVFEKWGFVFDVPNEPWHMRHIGTVPAGLDIDEIPEIDEIVEEDETEMKPTLITHGNETILVDWFNLRWRRLWGAETAAHIANGAVVTVANAEDFNGIKKNLPEAFTGAR